MTYFATVNPANTTDLSLTDRNGKQLVLGARNVEIPDYAGGFILLSSIQAASPSQNLYEVTPGTPCTPAGHYQDVRTYAFSGTVGNAAARVVETYACGVSEQIPIDDLLRIRQGELSRIAQQVEDQGRTVTGLSDGDKDMKTSDDMRILYLSMVAQAALPGATVFKVADLWNVFFPLTIADAQIVVDQITTFHDAARLANADSHNNQLNSLHGAGDWAGLSAYDLTTGWPPAPTPKAAAKALGR